MTTPVLVLQPEAEWTQGIADAASNGACLAPIEELMLYAETEYALVEGGCNLHQWADQLNKAYLESTGVVLGVGGFSLGNALRKGRLVVNIVEMG